MVRNPFSYGEVVTGEDFADRNTELEELHRDLKSGEKVFLISPRRYGKTSLVVNVLQRLRKAGVFTVYLDLYRAASLRQLLELYARGIAGAAETKVEAVLRLLKEILPGLRPTVSLAPDGTPSIGLEYAVRDRDVLELLEQVYEAPERIAKKRKRRFVVAFDEFQEVRNLNGEAVEKAMRASFQHHREVGYVFAGSKRSLLYDMVSNKAGAFYKLGKVMTLGKIPRNEFRPFLEKRFHKSSFRLEEGVMERILDLAEDLPYNAQFLCHGLWDRLHDTKKIGVDQVEYVLERILAEESPLYLTIWDNLSLHQRRVLQAIAGRGGRNIFSQDFLQDTNLGALPSVQTSVRLLMKKGILGREDDVYSMTDVFFKDWIRRKMS